MTKDSESFASSAKEAAKANTWSRIEANLLICVLIIFVTAGIFTVVNPFL